MGRESEINDGEIKNVKENEVEREHIDKSIRSMRYLGFFYMHYHIARPLLNQLAALVGQANRMLVEFHFSTDQTDCKDNLRISALSS